MRSFCLILLLFFSGIKAQQISGIQLFNPKTNDSTPIIGMEEYFVLRFDDLSSSSQTFRYTIKHYDRNWEDDGLFFTEFAKGSLNAIIDNVKYSFNTFQKYKNYELIFPNDKIKPIISGNYEIIVYTDSVEKPLFKKRFCMVENQVNLGFKVSRFFEKQNPKLNQRLEIQGGGAELLNHIRTISLTILQNNNWNTLKQNFKPSSVLGGKILFQQPNLVFAGNNEFYYFNSRSWQFAFDTVASVQQENDEIHTFLYPIEAYPMDYRYYPDVNGAFYFRRTDASTERDPHREGQYTWVYFSLPSEPIDKEIYVLGGFNDFTPDSKYKMNYNAEKKIYEARIYLKQGFYNYILATKGEELDFGEINGNFWQTENLYQGLIYYRPFGRNYDGILGYGEYRKNHQP